MVAASASSSRTMCATFEVRSLPFPSRQCFFHVHADMATKRVGRVSRWVYRARGSSHARASPVASERDLGRRERTSRRRTERLPLRSARKWSARWPPSRRRRWSHDRAPNWRRRSARDRLRCARPQQVAEGVGRAARTVTRCPRSSSARKNVFARSSARSSVPFVTNTSTKRLFVGRK
jgi:hypothetical protein